MTSLHEVYISVVGRDGDGADGKSALEMRDAWSSWSISCNFVRFLASCDISLSFMIFCYLVLLN